ncbi:MAG: SEC-C domain-containing protein [Pseudomonadales bacterium]|nr:SEC-C domain-containing protein [Pseudomonadales bacterium]MCP5330024.1 SEC-C domain-containing protein [Pseudomonadales bacterium]MCP5343067.1 SEC-C domain-containing protein [Pseudomonadales bacterium]
MPAQSCPCQSGKTFAHCCSPYLSGRENPRTVKQLMRSRYSAFALGSYGQYLYDTWHPDYRGALQPEDLDARELNWLHLDVIDAQQKGDRGSVEFIARFSEADGTQGEHHERSRFLREQGRWRYLDGEIF